MPDNEAGSPGTEEEGPVFRDEENNRSGISLLGTLAWFAGTLGLIILLMRLAIEWAVFWE